MLCLIRNPSTLFQTQHYLVIICIFIYLLFQFSLSLNNLTKLSRQGAMQEILINRGIFITNLTEALLIRREAMITNPYFLIPKSLKTDFVQGYSQRMRLQRRL